MSTNQQPARGMSSLRRVIITCLGFAVASAGVALLATVPTTKHAGAIWPLHPHNLAAWTGMLSAWIFLGLALMVGARLASARRAGDRTLKARQPPVSERLSLRRRQVGARRDYRSRVRRVTPQR